MRDYEQIVQGLKSRLRSDSYLEVIAIHADDVVWVGAGLLEIGLGHYQNFLGKVNACDIVAQIPYPVKLSLGKLVLENLFNGKVGVVVHYNNTEKGSVRGFYEDKTDSLIKI